MKKLKRKKNLFDAMIGGGFDDRALALRMREWMAKGDKRIASRAFALYEKQSDEKRAELAKHGLTAGFVEQQKRMLNSKTK